MLPRLSMANAVGDAHAEVEVCSTINTSFAVDRLEAVAAVDEGWRAR